MLKYRLCSVVLLAAVLIGCSNSDDGKGIELRISISEAENITINSALMSVEFSASNARIAEVGCAYSTALGRLNIDEIKNYNGKTVDFGIFSSTPSVSGIFNCELSGLADSATYYVRPFIKLVEVTADFPAGYFLPREYKSFTTFDFKSFSLSFDPNGGTINGTSTPLILSADSGSIVANAYSKIQSPIRDGYVFDGWYANPRDKVSISTELVRGNLNLYAHWIGFADKLFGRWQDFSDADEDQVLFKSNGTGFNQWSGMNVGGYKYMGVNFTYTATNFEIETIITEAFWLDPNTNRHRIDNDQNTIKNISGVSAPFHRKLSYSISADGNTLYIPDWSREYKRIGYEN